MVTDAQFDAVVQQLEAEAAAEELEVQMLESEAEWLEIWVAFDQIVARSDYLQ